jgi:hypothetical protein
MLPVDQRHIENRRPNLGNGAWVSKRDKRDNIMFESHELLSKRHAGRYTISCRINFEKHLGSRLAK